MRGPASAIAPMGALTPAAPAIGIASNPSAADMECCGLYHIDLTRLSMRRPLNRPVAHRVDVQVGQLLERLALATPVPPGVQPFGAGRDDGKHDRERRAHRRERRSPCGDDERRDEQHARAERIDLERLFDLAQVRRRLLR